MYTSVEGLERFFRSSAKPVHTMHRRVRPFNPLHTTHSRNKSYAFGGESDSCKFNHAGRIITRTYIARGRITHHPVPQVVSSSNNRKCPTQSTHSLNSASSVGAESEVHALTRFDFRKPSTAFFKAKFIFPIHTYQAHVISRKARIISLSCLGTLNRHTTLYMHFGSV